MSQQTGVLDAPPLHVPGIERKNGGPGADGVLKADDATGVVEALVSVTGVEDQVKDIIIPGAYAKTLGTRKPKGVFSHDWGRWVARTEVVEEWMPGDKRLPQQTKDGAPWPTAAGALYVRMRFNLKTREGRDAYENVKFFSETGECEWSIGYHVPDGKGVRDKAGVRHIKELDLFEYSPVLFGAAPLSGTLAVKSRLATITDAKDREEQFERLIHEEGIDWDKVDDAATGLYVADLVAKSAALGTSLSLPVEVLAEAFAEAGVEAWAADPDEAKALTDTTWGATPALAEADEWVAMVLTEAKFDPTGDAHTRAPLGHGDNWVNRAGGLPMLIRRVAHHLIDKGRPESVAIATAVNWAKKMCASGRAFGGKVKVSKEAQAAACSAVAEWERKKAQSHAGKALLERAAAGEFEIPGLEKTGGLTAAKIAARKSTETADDDRAPYAIDNRDDLKAAIQAFDRAKPEEKSRVKQWIIRRARPLDALDMLPAGWNVTKDVLAEIPEFKGAAEIEQQLNHWYESGGGATAIKWGTDGDMHRCVTTAMKNGMSKQQARGFCALRRSHAPIPSSWGGSPIRRPTAASKGLDEVVPEWSPEAEVGEFASTKSYLTVGEAREAAAGVKEFPFLNGSYEESQNALRAALNDALLGDPLPEPERDGDSDRLPSYDRGRREWSYIDVVGTYPDRVIARRSCHYGPNEGKTETYEVPYTLNMDGTVDLGDPTPVVIEVTAEVVGARAEDDDGDYGYDDDEDGDATPDPQFIVLGALKAVDQVALGVQLASEWAAETKAGRVLSTANITALKSALENLIEVLKRAGVDLDEQKNAEPETAETKGAVPTTVGPLTFEQKDGRVLLDPAAVAAHTAAMRAVKSPT